MRAARSALLLASSRPSAFWLRGILAACAVTRFGVAESFCETQRAYAVGR